MGEVVGRVRVRHVCILGSAVFGYTVAIQRGIDYIKLRKLIKKHYGAHRYKTKLLMLFFHSFYHLYLERKTFN